MKKKEVATLIALLAFIVFTVFFLGFRNTSDKKAYEATLNTMSMNKAKRFFARYPQSKYKDQLITKITGWCKHENTEECYRMILDTIPKNDKQFEPLLFYYEKHFFKNKNIKGKEGLKTLN